MRESDDAEFDGILYAISASPEWQRYTLAVLMKLGRGVLDASDVVASMTDHEVFMAVREWHFAHEEIEA